MRIRTIAMSIATVVGVAILGVTVVATVGQARAEPSQCTGSNMCVWGNNDYSWLLADEPQGQGVNRPFSDSEDEDNQADSWQNRSSTHAGCLFDNANGSSPLLTMNPQGQDGNMSFTDSDKASSMQTNGACP